MVSGATGGIGMAICHALANVGATLVVGYHRSECKAKSLVSSLTQSGGNGHFAVCMPVTDSAALRASVGLVLQKVPRVDILINCVGTTRFVPHADLDSLDDDLIDEILRVNVRGMFSTIRAFRETLMSSAAGLVINISSIAAQTAMGSNVMYCASKAAVENMTRSLGRALAPTIRVVAVAPGLVDTDFVKSMDVKWRNQQAQLTPLGRLTQSTEVADAVVAVATLLRFTTGSTVAVDGGRPLSC